MFKNYSKFYLSWISQLRLLSIDPDMCVKGVFFTVKVLAQYKTYRFFIFQQVNIKAKSVDNLVQPAKVNQNQV